jgi:hypothetical protein
VIETSQIDTDVSRELCSLLQLRPAEVRVERTAVLTTTPSVWAQALQTESLQIFDLSLSLGTRTAPTTMQADPTGSRTLAAAVVSYEPQAAIVDFTIPFGLRFPPTAVLSDSQFSLLGMVPDNLRDLGSNPIAVQQLLLAWAASLSSVRAISTLTPSALTTDPDDDWLRQYLSSRLQLCAVVELPSDLLRPLTSAPASLLYFGGSRKDAYFDNLSSRGDLVGMESRPWYRSLNEWLTGPKFAITVDRGFVAAAEPGHLDEEDAMLPIRERAEPPTIREANVSYAVQREGAHAWSPEVDDAEIVRMDEKVRKLGASSTIGELCEIVVGVSKPRLVAQAEPGIALVEPRNFKDGTLDVDGAARVEVGSASAEARVRVRDILLSLDRKDGFAVALNRYNGPAILSDGVVAIRCRSEKVSPEYLFEYLRSSRARNLLAARAGSSMLSIEALCNMPVPVIPHERLKELDELQRAERDLRQKADELQAERRNLFDVDNEKDFTNHLDALRRRGKVLSVSMKSLESLDHQIAVTYPFPIAYGYRLLESSSDPRDQYKEQFRIAENMLAFLGSICLALLHPEDRHTAHIDPGRGMTIGKWRDIITLNSPVLWTYRDDPLALAISRLNIGSKKKGFGGDIEEIVEARNEWAHMRDSSLVEDLIVACSKRQESLKRCMDSLGFLADYPIRRIEDDSRPHAGEWHFRCAAYQGDHPGLQKETVVFRSELPDGNLKRDLFLDLGNERWISLYPFISVESCQKCKWRETYYVDRWDAEKESADIKSFERGHMETRKDPAAALKHWTPREEGVE